MKYKNINVKNMYNINGCLYIFLDNNKKLLYVKDEMYDVSNLDWIKNVIVFNDNILIVDESNKIIDLKTKDILFNELDVISIKQIDSILKILFKNKEKIYDIKNKNLLNVPLNYTVLKVVNNFYILKNKIDNKLCIMDLNFNRVLDNITGKIVFKDNLLIINGDKLEIVKENSISSFKKNKYNLTKPLFYKNNIIVIKKNCIKICDLDLNLIKEIKMPLKEIKKSEVVDNVLILLIPGQIKNSNQNILINLNDYKMVKHDDVDIINTDSKIYIGYDRDTKLSYFYNSNLDIIKKIQIRSYRFLNSAKECLFLLDFGRKNKILNMQDGSLSNTNYGNIWFENKKNYGIAFSGNCDIVNIVDEDLKVLNDSLNLKKHNLDDLHQLYSMLVNNYLIFFKYILKNNCLNISNLFIKKLNGEVVIQSNDYQFEVLDKYIKIYNDDEMFFLDTITGDIGSLDIDCPIKNKKMKVKYLNMDCLNIANK